MDLLPEVANQTENEKVKTAYVPISTGCSQFCSYCIVPFAR
jgi:tRNA A37 methylthiotransferase MiaB